MKEIEAGCGLIIKESEGFVCPYFLGRGRSGYSSCGIDVQAGTNVCLHSMLLDLDEYYEEGSVRDV